MDKNEEYNWCFLVSTDNELHEMIWKYTKQQWQIYQMKKAADI